MADPEGAGETGTGGALKDWLKKRIEIAGPMTVESYMRACLLNEEHGYYHHQQAIGAAGDFITAPEISQIFGELIGIWVAATWEMLGKPAAWRLVEFGPGRGTLMADMLRALQVVPQARSGVRVLLDEINERLKVQQEAALAPTGVPVTWRELGAMDIAPPLPTIVIANEFLDALPMRQWIAKASHWHERCVGVDGEGNLCFLARDITVSLEDVAAVALTPDIDGSICEVMSGAAVMLEAWTQALSTAPQVHLYIDYGHVGPVLGDTLQAVGAHRYVDPLADPGATDLSAQVDFAQIAAVAREAGLTPYGPITQAELLGRLGAAERLGRLCAGKDARTVNDLHTGLARLMDPSGMGTRFKALALSSDGLAAPPVF